MVAVTWTSLALNGGSILQLSLYRNVFLTGTKIASAWLIGEVSKSQLVTAVILAVQVTTEVTSLILL